MLLLTLCNTFSIVTGIMFGMVVMFESGMVIVCAGVAEQELLDNE